MEKIPKINKCRAFNKAVGPTSIPDSRVAMYLRSFLTLLAKTSQP